MGRLSVLSWGVCRASLGTTLHPSVSPSSRADLLPTTHLGTLHSVTSPSSLSFLRKLASPGKAGLWSRESFDTITQVS